MALDIPVPSASPYDDPDQYLPLILSAIEGFLLAQDVWTPETYSDARGYMEQLKRYVVDCWGKCEDVMYSVSFGEFHAWSFRLAYGTTLTRNLSTAYPGNGYIEVTPTALGNAIERDIALEPATYTLTIWGQTNSNCGLVTAYLDGDAQGGAVDWRGGAGVLTTRTHSIVIPDRQPHMLRLEVTGTTGLGNSYRFMPAYMIMQPA